MVIWIFKCVRSWKQTSPFVYLCTGGCSLLVSTFFNVETWKFFLCWQQQLFQEQVFISVSSLWWTRGRKTAILIVIDSNCFLIFYFYKFTLCVNVGLRLCQLDVGVFDSSGENYVWSCFNLSNHIKQVSTRNRHLICFPGWEQLLSFPNDATVQAPNTMFPEMSTQQHQWNELTTPSMY